MMKKIRWEEVSNEHSWIRLLIIDAGLKRSNYWEIKVDEFNHMVWLTLPVGNSLLETKQKTFHMIKNRGGQIKMDPKKKKEITFNR